jgi:hypothetical protein
VEAEEVQVRGISEAHKVIRRACRRQCAAVEVWRATGWKPLTAAGSTARSQVIRRASCCGRMHTPPRPPRHSSRSRRRFSKATSEMSAQFASLARTTVSPTSNPAPQAALAYATAGQAMETHAVVRPHPTATPVAAILWETTTRVPSSFLRRYAFTKHRCTDPKTCCLSAYRTPPRIKAGALLRLAGRPRRLSPHYQNGRPHIT